VYTVNAVFETTSAIVANYIDKFTVHTPTHITAERERERDRETDRQRKLLKYRTERFELITKFRLATSQTIH